MNDKIKMYLIELLKANKDTPEQLAEKLIELKALTPEFLFSLLESKKLKQIVEQNTDRRKSYFKDIKTYREYYNSMNDDFAYAEADEQPVTKEEMEKWYSTKLDEALDTEDYVRAAYLRDLMQTKKLSYLQKNI